MVPAMFISWNARSQELLQSRRVDGNVAAGASALKSTWAGQSYGVILDTLELGVTGVVVTATPRRVSKPGGYKRTQRQTRWVPSAGSRASLLQ